MTATPIKLRNGTWGARVQGTVQAGDQITITARNGKTWQAAVAQVVWSGQGVSLVATTSGASNGASSRSGGRRGKWTGCSCGSREIDGTVIDSPRNCRTCAFEAQE